MGKNWIVALGDSFTYGDELPDDDLARGNQHLRAVIKTARSYRKFNDIPIEVFEQRNKYIKLMCDEGLDYKSFCNSYTYINKACVTERIGCRNLAVNGRSVDHILIDLIDYFEYNQPSGEIFVIGTGLNYRHTKFDQNKKEYASDNWRFMANEAFGSGNDDFFDYVYEYFSNQEYHEIMYQSAVDEMRYILESHNTPYYIFNVKERLDQITSEHKLGRCAFGHNDQQAHQILSDEIALKIREIREQLND